MQSSYEPAYCWENRKELEPPVITSLEGRERKRVNIFLVANPALCRENINHGS